MTKTAQDKRKRIEDIRSALSASGRAGKQYQTDTNSTLFSPVSKNLRAHTREGKAERIAKMASMFGETHQKTSKPFSFYKPGTVQQTLPVKGWPPKPRVYKVEELIKWWRFLWNRHMGTIEAPQPPIYYMRKHLLSWLSKDGYRIVEDLMEFSFQHWERIRSRVTSLHDAEGPTLQIVYAYRSMFREMWEKLSQTKKWASTWKGLDFDTEVEVLDAI